MPSLLTEYKSEPVKLATNEDNPYEPPHRTLTEKSSNPIQSAKAYLVNGKQVEGLAKGKNLEGILPVTSDDYVDSQYSSKSRRPSDGTDSQRGTRSRRGSNNSPRNSLSVSRPGSVLNSDLNNGAKPIPKDRSVSAQASSAPNHIHDPGSESMQPKKFFNKGHGRVHSSSSPTIPSSLNPLFSGQNGGAGNGDIAGSNRDSTHSLNKYPITPSPLTGQHGHTNSSSTKALHPHAPRLVSRHTLEVPRVSTSRSSRDFSLPNTLNDGASETGRLSPTIRTPRASHTLVRAGTRSVNSDMNLDDIAPDDDMARWTENIRQKRASRRKRKEEEEDDRVVVGTKVDMNHVNWVTAYNMLTGIRFTVSRTNAKIDRELTDGDFDARNKFSFDITGNELTPSAKYDFKFKDYAPWVFRHLRAQFGRDPADYLVSLTSKYILSELGSPGKSGSFFYFSRDYKYIIKTIHHAEHKLLRKILRDYYAHIKKYPNTLISQFYGLHRVKIPYGRKIHFVVMNNLFPPHRDIHQTFDLKGSTIGRDFKEEDLANNPRATLKDLNWLRRNNHFEFGPHKKALFVEQMKHDVELLQRLKIMDYSLLVGIHDLNRGNEENLRDKTLQVFQPGGEGNGEPQMNMLTRTPSKLENARHARQLREIIKKEKPVPIDKSTSKMPDQILEERKDFVFYSDDGGFRATHEDGQAGEEIYYLGIIDCLTHYGIIKKVEHLWKGLSNNKSQISPIPPEGYGNRFVKFIGGLTKTKEEAERDTVQQASDALLEGSNATTPRRQSSNLSFAAVSRRSTDKVIEKAEKQAEKSEKDGANEDPRSDRVLSSVRSPSAERTGGVGGATLPVVEEAGEAGSREDSVMDEKGVSVSKTTHSTNAISTTSAPVAFKERPTSNCNSSTASTTTTTTTTTTSSPTTTTQLPSIPQFNRLSMGLSGAISPTRSDV